MGLRGPKSKCGAEQVKQVERLCKLGATDADIAEFFDTTPRNIRRWKHDHPKFNDALKRGKAVADDMVEQSLFRMATGYSRDAVKILQHEGVPVLVDYVEFHPPTAIAAIFWLKNRKPAEWRDKQEHEHAGKDGAPLIPVLNVVINGGDQSKSAP